mgnify:FL=1
MNGLTSANVCGSATPSSRQISQIERVLKQMDENKRMLLDSIILLEEKLSPITRPQNPSVGECEKEESLIPLAEAIRKFGNDFAFADVKIRSLIERIEI